MTRKEREALVERGGRVADREKDQSCLCWSIEEAANFSNEMDLVQLVVVVRWFLSRLKV